MKVSRISEMGKTKETSLLPIEEIREFTEKQKSIYLKNLIRLFFLSNYEKDFQELNSIIENIDFIDYISLLINLNINLVDVLSFELYLAIRADGMTHISQKDIYAGICKILQRI